MARSKRATFYAGAIRNGWPHQGVGDGHFVSPYLRCLVFPASQGCRLPHARGALSARASFQAFHVVLAFDALVLLRIQSDISRLDNALEYAGHLFDR